MADPRSLDFILGAKNLAEKELLATQQRIQQMGSAVDRLNADFKRGAIGPEVFKQQLAVVRSEATRLAPVTRGLAGSELNQLEQILGKTSVTTGNAGAAFSKLRGPAQALALELTGLSGTGGRAVGVLAQLGLGAGPMVVIAAGIAALSLLVRYLNRDYAEATKRADDLTKSLKQQADAAVSEVDQVRQAYQDLARERQKLVDQLGDGTIVVAAQGDLERRIGELSRRMRGLAGQFLQTQGAKREQEEQRQEEARKKRFQDMLADAQLEADSVGKTADQLYVLQLRRQGLTEAEIQALVAARKLREERERTLQLEELASLRASSRAASEARDRAKQLAPLQLRGVPQPGAAPTALQAGAAEAQEQKPSFGEQLLGGLQFGLQDTGEEMKKLAGDVNTVAGAAEQMGRSFATGFERAREAGKGFGSALKAGASDALRDLAQRKAKFYFGEGLAALGGALFPHFNPKALVAAGKYFAAAAVFSALAGGGGGGGGGGSASSGGGSGGGDGSSTRDRSNADNRPIVFQVTIAGERTGETVVRQSYEVARYKNLGGRPAGMPAQITLPAGIVIARGVGS